MQKLLHLKTISIELSRNWRFFVSKCHLRLLKSIHLKYFNTAKEIVKRKWNLNWHKYRKNHSQMFSNVKTFAKLTGKHLCQNLQENTCARVSVISLKKRIWKKSFSPVKFVESFSNTSGDAEIIAGKYDIMKTW